jgi:hypothetical protein
MDRSSVSGLSGSLGNVGSASSMILSPTAFPSLPLEDMLTLAGRPPGLGVGSPCAPMEAPNPKPEFWKSSKPLMLLGVAAFLFLLYVLYSRF